MIWLLTKLWGHIGTNVSGVRGPLKHGGDFSFRVLYGNAFICGIEGSIPLRRHQVKIYASSRKMIWGQLGINQSKESQKSFAQILSPYIPCLMLNFSQAPITSYMTIPSYTISHHLILNRRNPQLFPNFLILILSFVAVLLCFVKVLAEDFLFVWSSRSSLLV